MSYQVPVSSTVLVPVAELRPPLLAHHITWDITASLCHRYGTVPDHGAKHSRPFFLSFGTLSHSANCRECSHVLLAHINSLSSRLHAFKPVSTALLMVDHMRAESKQGPVHVTLNAQKQM